VADFADLASDRELLDTEQAIAAARRPIEHVPVACGECHNCGATVQAGATFCDVDCRDDWQARRRAAIR